jgi:hypothetical protein
MNACNVFQLLIGLLAAHTDTADNWSKINPVLEYQRSQCVIIEKKAKEDEFQAETKSREEAKKKAESKK